MITRDVVRRLVNDGAIIYNREPQIPSSLFSTCAPDMADIYPNPSVNAELHS